MPQTEFRILKATSLRAGRAGNSNDAPPLIEGYAAVFSRLSSDLGGFREKIKPGAFTRAIKEKQEVHCLFNHSADMVLGRLSAGTLSVKEDSRGLFYRCVLPDTQLARDLHVLVSRGDISQNSFSFSVPVGGQSWMEDKLSANPDDDNYDPDFDPDEDDALFACRTLTDVNLRDCAPCTLPAYPQTELTARAEKRSRSNNRIYSEATMQNFTLEQRLHLSGTCGNRFAEIPEGCPELFRTKLIEHRARVLGMQPAGKPATESLPVNTELADELAALKSL